MGIGVGLFLLAIGAILTFAVNVAFSSFSLATIGIILMVVGGLGILLDLLIFMPRRRRVVTQQTSTDPYAGQRTVTQEHQIG